MKSILITACILLTLITYVQAEKDNTGTNPINFSNDVRVHYNYAELDSKGDSDSQTTTVEYAFPISETWQFRARTRHLNNQIDVTGNGVNDVDASGLGDTDIRILNVPYLNMEKKMAVAVGLEVTFDTADKEVLGAGSTMLGPQLFMVFFNPIGGGTLVAPAYQHVFDVSGDKVNQSRLDLFYLYTFKSGLINWALINPQGVLDYENEKDHWNIDVEMGKMLTKNHSLYLRPSSAFGSDRFYNWNVEVGLKVIW